MDTKENNRSRVTPSSIILVGIVVALTIIGLSMRARSRMSPSSLVIRETDPVLGVSTAPVTIFEFADFECPFCSRFSIDTKPQIIENEIKAGTAKLVWKDFPLSIHSHAELAHEDARCAQEQGKFWEYHDLLYQNQSHLDEPHLKIYAGDIGLVMDTFTSCLATRKYKKLIEEGMADGSKIGFTGTPSFTINNIILIGAQPYYTFVEVIRAAAKNRI